MFTGLLDHMQSDLERVFVLLKRIDALDVLRDRLEQYMKKQGLAAVAKCSDLARLVC